MPELTERQKAIRGTRIGASEVGALVPPYIHPWTSPDLIYSRIVDGPDKPVSNAFMEAGHALERAIGQVAADKLGLRLRACSLTYIHPDLPLAASPDFYARDIHGPPDGDARASPGLLEVKLSREWSDWLDGPPPYYDWQVRTQLLLTGRPWAILAALVGTTLQTYRIDREPAKETELIAGVERFVSEYLEPRKPPPTKDERLMLRWHLGPGVLVAGARLEEAGDDYARQVRTRRKAEAWEATARARFVLESQKWPGAELILGNGWNAKTDERGSMRFDVKRRADE